MEDRGASKVSPFGEFPMLTLNILLHGQFGILDELLACGILLAFGLIIFFLAMLFGKGNKSPER